MALGLVAAGAGALAGLTGFVVVLGSGGTASNALATPTFNIDALPASAQGYLPYLEQGGLVCSEVDAALLAAQVSAADPSWGPSLVTTRTYTYRSTTGMGSHNKAHKVTVTITYEGLLQQTPAWWASHGLSAETANPVPGSADPFDPRDAIATLAAYDCSLAGQLDAEALSSTTGLPTDELVAAAFNDGAGVVSAYTQSFHSLPPDPQTQAVVSELTLYSLSGTGASPGGGGGPVTTVPGNPPNGSLGAGIVAAAQGQLGTPYVWGGGSYSGPSDGGFDCSGLVLYAVYQASHGAIALPHYTASQVGMGQQVIVGTGAQALASGLLQPGDLVFFDNIDPSQLGWDHVGIYVGNGDMIDAPRTGTVVQVDDLATAYWEGVQWDVQRFA